MRRWAYKKEIFLHDWGSGYESNRDSWDRFVNYLNGQGEQGWELVSFKYTDYSNHSHHDHSYLCLFKRFGGEVTRL